jgi:hypothetical protein
MDESRPLLSGTAQHGISERSFGPDHPPLIDVGSVEKDAEGDESALLV